MHKDFLLSEKRTRGNGDKISSIKLLYQSLKSNSSSHACLEILILRGDLGPQDVVTFFLQIVCCSS